jgi:hypothetical protein
MEWALLALALVLLVGLALARARHDGATSRGRGRKALGRRRRGAADELQLVPDDEAELAREFAAVEHEHAHVLDALLNLRLRTVHSRRVPLRAIRAAPGPHTGRLVFANGTVLLARARRPGELYTVALNLRNHAVCLDSWTREADGTVLHLRWADESAELLVLGLDQAD